MVEAKAGSDTSQTTNRKTIEKFKRGFAYKPQEFYNQNQELKAAINLIATGHFSHGDRELFRPVVNSLLYEDPYMVLADYQAYIDCQQQVGEVFLEPERWTRMAILNASRMGKFSSDRSITEYCQKIWDVKPFPVTLKVQRLPDNGIKFPKRNRIVRT